MDTRATVQRHYMNFYRNWMKSAIMENVFMYMQISVTMKILEFPNIRDILQKQTVFQ